MNNNHIQTISSRTLIMMLVTTCLGVRWIPFASSIGPFSIVLWLIAGLMFFLPLSFMVLELSLNYPQNGGISLWVTKGLGHRSGFFTAWFYWVNNVVYYPGMLSFIALNIARLSGKNSLIANQIFIMFTIICCFWLAIILNIRGIRSITKVATISGFSNLRLCLTLIVAGAYYYFSRNWHSATNFNNFIEIPHKSNTLQLLSNLSILMFALAGVEVIPTFCRASRTKDTSLIKSILISSFLLLTLYLCSTIALNLIVKPSEINSNGGFIPALQIVILRLHWPLWLINALIISIVFVDFGRLNLWLITSNMVFFHGTAPNILPNWLQRLNANHVPVNGLILQGVLVTVIIILISFMPSINFMELILMSAVIYFLPYLFLSVAYLKLRHNNALHRLILSDKMAKLVAIMVYSSVLLAIVLAFIPTTELQYKHNLIIYELELIAIPVGFFIMGYIIYSHRKISFLIKDIFKWD
ncbi:MAG: hypothetical protein RLZZ293_891 [Pseudomonadota bacterium]|jgi:amino acid transporter